MPTLQKVDSFIGDVGKGLINLNTDTFKACLLTVAPTNATTVYANTNEVATNYGYTQTGVALTGVTWTGASTNPETWTLAATGPTPLWTASGGTIGPFRYLLVYSSTSTAKNVVGYLDYGSSISLLTAETLTLTDASGLVAIT